MLIDTHCHLDAAEFATDRRAVHALARSAGVSDLIVPGVAVGSFATLKATVDTLPGCHAAYGIHPLFVDTAEEPDLQTLEDWLDREQPVALGEIGLDFSEEGVDRERQLRFFRAQLRLARERDLPVILHTRRANDAVLAELRRTPVRGGFAHAFNGSPQQAAAFLQLGFKLGFGGACTYPGSTRIRHLAATLPLSALVLETDAPDIPPVWLKRGRNTPGELPGIAAELAALRGLPVSELSEATRRNALEILDLT